MRRFLFVLFLAPVVVFSQKTAIVKGFVTNKQNKPIENVTVSFENTGTTTKKNGYYEIRIPLNKVVNSPLDLLVTTNCLKNLKQPEFP